MSRDIESMLAELRAMGHEPTMGSQDLKVGFPASSPPGWWIQIGGTSWIAPTLTEAISDCLDQVGEAQ